MLVFMVTLGGHDESTGGESISAKLLHPGALFEMSSGDGLLAKKGNIKQHEANLGLLVTIAVFTEVRLGWAVNEERLGFDRI
jgi:hypothetical protein